MLKDFLSVFSGLKGERVFPRVQRSRGLTTVTPLLDHGPTWSSGAGKRTKSTQEIRHLSSSKKQEYQGYTMFIIKQA